jgi:hypothetical protein
VGLRGRGLDAFFDILIFVNLGFGGVRRWMDDADELTGLVVTREGGKVVFGLHFGLWTLDFGFWILLHVPFNGWVYYDLLCLLVFLGISYHDDFILSCSNSSIVCACDGPCALLRGYC